MTAYVPQIHGKVVLPLVADGEQLETDLLQPARDVQAGYEISLGGFLRYPRVLWNSTQGSKLAGSLLASTHTVPRGKEGHSLVNQGDVAGAIYRHRE